MQRRRGRGSTLAAPGWVAALVLVLVLAGAAGAGEPLGPQFGDNRFTTAIASETGADVDQFVGDLIEGETLTVVVKALKGSTLSPRMDLIDPTGNKPPLETRTRRNGRVLKLSGHRVNRSGRWTVRTWGGDQTTGRYQISFKVRRAAKVSRRNVRVGGPNPSSVTYTFPGFPGATVDLVLRSRTRNGSARLLALRDPDGNAVAGVPASAFQPPKSTRKPLRVRALRLTGRAGTYTAEVGIPPQKAGDGSESIDVTVTVHDPDRPRSRKAQGLTPDEPRFDLPPKPLAGPPGTRLVLRGAHFSAPPLPPPRLLFGDREAQITASTPTAITCTVPEGENETTVDLFVVNPDGQVGVLSPGFRFLVPEILPGFGFGGPTPQPGTVGSGPGADAKVIARWDCVPYQDVDAPFALGVVAFHINGIDRVEFSAQGGPVTTVDRMTLNPRTGVWEYWAQLDPARFPDGSVEVRAVVYPDVGIPRVLQGPIGDVVPAEHSMFLFANSGGTLPRDVRWIDAANGSDGSGDGSEQNPFATVFHALQDIHLDRGAASGSCDGAIVYCKPGSYSWGPPTAPYPSSPDRWITITPAPGVAKADVVFDTSAHPGFRTEKIRAKGFTMLANAFFNTISAGSRQLWIDDVEMLGPGHPSDFRFFLAGNWNAVYATDVRMSGCRTGMKGVHFVRNADLSDLTDDAFSMCRVLLNSRVHHIDQAGFSSYHVDVFQFAGSGSEENFVVYGLEATDCRAQLLFADDLARLDNVAFVNVLASRPRDLAIGTGLASQWKDPSTNHLLLYHVSLPNGDFLWRQGGTRENIAVVGCVIGRMDSGETFSQRFRDNHYIVTDPSSTPRGASDTSGPCAFVDEDAHDYTPAPGSILRDRVVDLVVPVDLRNQPRAAPTSVGAIR